MYVYSGDVFVLNTRNGFSPNPKSMYLSLSSSKPLKSTALYEQCLDYNCVVQVRGLSRHERRSTLSLRVDVAYQLGLVYMV